MDALIFVAFVLVLTLVVCMVVGSTQRWLLAPLLCGFIARLAFLSLNYYGMFSPPGADGDAQNFTFYAYTWSQNSWADVFATFDYSRSFVYSSIGAVFFKLVGFHPLVLPSLNVVAGMLGIVLVGKMAYELWGRKASIISAYIMGGGIPEAKNEIRKKTTDKLTPHQKALYDLVCEANEIGGGELYEAYCERVSDPKTRRTMRNHLSKLQQYNLITTTGKTKNKTYSECS